MGLNWAKGFSEAGNAVADVGKGLIEQVQRKEILGEQHKNALDIEARREAALAEREKRVQQKFADAESKASGLINDATRPTTPNDDEGNPNPAVQISRSQEAALRAAAYRQAGLPAEAGQFERDAQTAKHQDETLAETRRYHDLSAADREAQRELEEQRLDDQREHNKASLGIQGAAARRAQTLLDEQIKDLGLARTIKELQVDQAKELKKYRELATSEQDPAKKAAYREAYQLLSGKDSDNFVSVLDKEKDAMGNESVKGVIKTDKRTGKVTYESVSALRGEGAAPYPDGTKLKGKDGKEYVVQNGVPVLKK